MEKRSVIHFFSFSFFRWLLSISIWSFFLQFNHFVFRCVFFFFYLTNCGWKKKMIGYIPKCLGAGISNRLSARTRASNFCANRTPCKFGWVQPNEMKWIEINTPRTSIRTAKKRINTPMKQTVSVCVCVVVDIHLMRSIIISTYLAYMLLQTFYSIVS